MRLVLVRIDDRLLHAQVVVGWGNVLSPDLYLVADDETASNPTSVNLLRIGLPSDVELFVSEVAEASQFLDNSVSDSRKCVLLVKGPFQMLRLLEAGMSVPTVNVGGMHFAEGKRRLLPYLYVDDTDIALLEQVATKVKKLTAQDVPGNPSHDVLKLLEKARSEKS